MHHEQMILLILYSGSGEFNWKLEISSNSSPKNVQLLNCDSKLHAFNRAEWHTRSTRELRVAIFLLITKGRQCCAAAGRAAGRHF
jgi:hypothetical protein